MNKQYNNLRSVIDDFSEIEQKQARLYLVLDGTRKLMATNHKPKYAVEVDKNYLVSLMKE